MSQSLSCAPAKSFATEAMEDASHPLWDHYDRMGRDMEDPSHPAWSAFDHEAPLEGRQMIEDDHPRIS